MTLTKMIYQARHLRTAIVNSDDVNEQRQLWRNLLDLYSDGPVGVQDYKSTWAEIVYVEKTIADLEHAGFGFYF